MLIDITHHKRNPDALPLKVTHKPEHFYEGMMRSREDRSIIVVLGAGRLGWHVFVRSASNSAIP